MHITQKQFLFLFAFHVCYTIGLLFGLFFGLLRSICNQNLSILIPDVARKKTRRTETEIEKVTKCMARLGGGAVKFDEQFHDVSDKIMGQLTKVIKKFESDYMTPYNGNIS